MAQRFFSMILQLNSVKKWFSNRCLGWQNSLRSDLGSENNTAAGSNHPQNSQDGEELKDGTQPGVQAGGCGQDEDSDKEGTG